MTDHDDDQKQEEEQSQDNDDSITWRRGDPEDRPAMDARGAESTDWMAAAELENEDSDLTDREKRRLRAEQAKRQRETEAARVTVVEKDDTGSKEDTEESHSE